MSEMDEITQQTGRTFRDVLTVAGQWLRTLRHTDTGSSDGSPKRLSRKQKRELGEYIASQLSAQRVTAAWYTKRVADYHDECAAFQQRRDRDPLYTDADRYGDYARLHAMRLRIEESLTHCPLAIEHRGQVVMALDHAEHHPSHRDRTVDEVFTPLDSDGQRQARAVAVESEQWVHACHQDMEREAAGLRLTERAQPPRTTPASRATTPGAGAAVRQELPVHPEILRVNAIQAIRHAEYKRRQQQAGGSGVDPATEVQRRRAADQAAAAGMTVEQIRWEFAHAEVNSRCQVTVSTDAPNGDRQALRSFHPSEADAAQFTRSVMRTNWWREGTQFTVQAREAGRRCSFYLAEGDLHEVSDSVDAWQREVGREQTEPPDRDRSTDEGSAPRVTVLQRSLDAVTKDRDDTRQRLATVTAELETLKNTQLAVQHELKTLREQVALTREERDLYRGERDEAVRKLAQATPEQDRYGSRERVQAEQATNGDTTPKPRRSTPRSR